MHTGQPGNALPKVKRAQNKKRMLILAELALRNFFEGRDYLACTTCSGNALLLKVVGTQREACFPEN